MWKQAVCPPGFIRLRQTVSAPMRQVMSPDKAARRIVDGMARRQSRIWLPGWVWALHCLRALRQAAPELEAMYLEVLATEGAAASPYPLRELQRAMVRDTRRARAVAAPRQP